QTRPVGGAAILGVDVQVGMAHVPGPRESLDGMRNQRKQGGGRRAAGRAGDFGAIGNGRRGDGLGRAAEPGEQQEAGHEQDRKKGHETSVYTPVNHIWSRTGIARSSSTRLTRPRRAQRSYVTTPDSDRSFSNTCSSRRATPGS